MFKPKAKQYDKKAQITRKILFAYLVSFNVFYQWMTVTSAIYMLYVFKERVDVELATKAMVSSAKRVSSVWKSILRFFSDVNSS